MNNIELKEYRTKLYTDLYSNTVPDRVPVTDSFGIEYFLKYAGHDLMTAQYTMNKDMVVDAMRKTREFARGDVFNTGSPRNPIAIMFQKSRMSVMSKSGFIQHPESASMSDTEFDEYIQHPFDFNQRVIKSRLSASYVEDPVMRMVNFAKVILATQDFSKMIAEANKVISDEFGLMTVPAGTSGMAPVAFDNLADGARGFSQIVMDIKRCPQKVLDAMDALMPYNIYRARKGKVHVLGSNNIMTHMGVFLRKKEFDKFYWPKFNEIVHISAEAGKATTIFCEGDWTRFIDELQDLPMGTRMFMEYGDPKEFKDRLGKKMVLGGFYPLTLYKNGTKQQCVDKAKELLDVLAPGGNYFFRNDKVCLDTFDMNPENYTAVMDYIFENAKYDNAGDKVSDMDKESTIVKGYADKYPEFKSQYRPTFEEFIADYPPADEKAAPLMKAAYDKYSDMAEAFLN